MLDLEGRNDGYVSGGAVVVGEVDSNRVFFHHRCIGLVCQSGVDMFVWFCMSAITEGGAYSVGVVVIGGD